MVLQGVVPDMVTLGKPIGNGFPMGAIILTQSLATGFDNGMQYFATCGACTAASAAGTQINEDDFLQSSVICHHPSSISVLLLVPTSPFFNKVFSFAVVKCASGNGVQ